MSGIGSLEREVVRLTFRLDAVVRCQRRSERPARLFAQVRSTAMLCSAGDIAIPVQGRDCSRNGYASDGAFRFVTVTYKGDYAAFRIHNRAPLHP